MEILIFWVGFCIGVSGAASRVDATQEVGFSLPSLHPRSLLPLVLDLPRSEQPPATASIFQRFYQVGQTAGRHEGRESSVSKISATVSFVPAGSATIRLAISRERHVIENSQHAERVQLGRNAPPLVRGVLAQKGSPRDK